MHTKRIVKAVMVATVGFSACLIAYWAINATQWTMAALRPYGAWRLMRARPDRHAFIAAKAPAAAGLLLVRILYFVGFVAVGGEWFSM